MIGSVKDCINYLLEGDPEERYEVRPHKAKRSISQNAYFHVLADKIADARTRRGDTVSKAAEKNELMAKYGQRMRDADGNPIGIKTNLEPERMRELEQPHTAYKEQTGDAYMYYWLKRSSELTTDEMSALIDGTIEDAKEWGVETWPDWKLQEVREREKCLDP